MQTIKFIRQKNLEDLDLVIRKNRDRFNGQQAFHNFFNSLMKNAT